ncbi:MAG: lactonase family protein [Acidobacteriota bacterium]|nr:lactonase family protein [Acidobacteriota bacterium]
MKKRISDLGLPVLLVSNLLLAGLTQAQTQTASSAPGAVFAATNGITRNEIIMYQRLTTGQLRWVGKFDTGGRGEGGINDPLASQSSLALTPDHSFLLAVNAGSSSISVFRVRDESLELVDVTPSRGGDPLSVTVHDDLVYVMNFGGSYHTAGFRMEPWGELKPIRGSRKTLSASNTEPSTIAFSPDGSKLVISERQTNNVDVFSVAPDGSISDPVFNAFTAVSPFGLQFNATGVLLVTSLGGSLTSYSVNPDNTLTVISANSPSSGAGTCWLINYGQQVWVSNTLSSTLGAYALQAGGSLEPLGVVATQPPDGPIIFPHVPPSSFPLDLAVSADGKYLYAVYSGLGQIYAYKTGDNGKLTAIGAVAPYKPQSGGEGLAAY